MKTVNVVAALILHENMFLIGKRSTGKLTGYWEFPGGKVEFDETSEEALIREMKEEFGVLISVNKLALTIDHQYPDFILKMDCFLCSTDTVSFQLNDHSEISWFDPTIESNELNWLPADVKIVEYLKSSNLNDLL